MAAALLLPALAPLTLIWWVAFARLPPLPAATKAIGLINPDENLQPTSAPSSPRSRGPLSRTRLLMGEHRAITSGGATASLTLRRPKL